jgi:adenosylhomocysteine nucleosidase
MTRTGIVVAMLPEARCIAGGARAGATTEIGPGLLLHVSGAGGARAERAAAILVDAGADRLLSFGTAGGLRPGIGPGAVLVPEAVATASGSVAVHTPWRRHVLARLAAARIAVTPGNVAEAAELVAGAAVKADLGTRHDAVAVDMESAAVLRVAARAALPALVVRVVMDPVELEFPRFVLRHTDVYGRASTAGIALDVLRAPARLPSLLRLIRTFSAAGAAMRAVARQLPDLHPGHDAPGAPR